MRYFSDFFVLSTNYVTVFIIRHHKVDCNVNCFPMKRLCEKMYGMIMFVLNPYVMSIF